MFINLTARPLSSLIRGALVSLTAIMLVAVPPVLAQSDGLKASSAKFTGERPNADGPPTQVSIGLFVFDVDAINDATQTYGIDMFITVNWNDPRLALPKRKRDGLIRRVPKEAVWVPRGLIINDRGLSRMLPETVEIDDKGNASLQQRVIGDLAVDLNFTDFPYDVQLLPVDLVSYANTTREVEFIINEKLSGHDGEFSIEGWELTLLEPKLNKFRMTEDGAERPRVTFVIGAERDSRYYILTMFLPMTMIILMAWSVFWLQPDVIPPRIGISTAAIFSFVAFGFSIRSNLPEVSYMTRADLFVTGCTLLVFLALAVTIAGSRLAKSERMEEALKLSSISRWLYLLLFALVYLFAFRF